MKTITFYSFKGGVGRSLTLSNMALWLADEMKVKVCVIDFDLEAPGLPYKFDDLQNPEDQERLARTEGIVEYVDEFNRTGFPPDDFKRFYLSFTTAKGNPISLIPAGNLQQADYWRKLFDINWQQLFEYDASTGYSKGLLLLEDLKGRIEAELAPDFLLIDSRTGLTETASITLKLMADKVILVGINNRENQDGLFWVLRSLHADPSSRDLPYHLVLNRVPMQYGTGRKEIDPREKMLRENFLKRFESLASLDHLAQRFSIIHADDEQAFEEKLQDGFYVESQPKVQIRKDYWDVFTQATKEYFTDEQWHVFDRKRKAYEVYYKAKFDTTDVQTQIDLINEAIGYCDDDAFLYNYRFTLFIEIKDYQKALKDINKVMELAPESPVAYYNLSVFLTSQEDYNQSIEKLHRAIKLKPDMYEAWYNLGGMYDKIGDFFNAIIAYQNVLNINPKMHEAWHNLGVIYKEKKDFLNAIEAYKQALRIKPDKSESWYNLGILYFEQSEYRLATVAFKKIIEIKKYKNDDAWHNLGDLYSLQSEYKLAIDSYQKALEINPNREGTWQGLVEVYIDLNSYGLAIDALKKILEINPYKWENWDVLGVLYAKQKKYSLSIKAYNKALRINPNNEKIWDNLVNSLIYKSYNKKERIKILQEALEAAQKSQELGGSVYNLSCVNSLLNNKSEALYWLQQALERKDVTVEHVQEDRDFDSLREDEDFKALLAKFSS